MRTLCSSRTSPLAARWLLAGVAALGLTAPLSAQLASISIAFSKAVYEANDTVVFTIEGPPGDVPLLMAGFDPGPTNVPGVGVLGLGLPAPAMYVLGPIPASGKLTLACLTNCDTPIIGESVFFQVITFTPGLKGASGLSNSALLRVISGDCGECVDEAEVDTQWTPYPFTHALLLWPLGNDFQLVAGGQFVEYEDGTAHLTGVVARSSDDGARFIMDIAFDDRVMLGDPGFLPPGSPKQDLYPGAYAAEGGPISPLLWRYYETIEGTLTGIEDYAGGVYSVTRVGPAFQVGYGASGKNLNMGASGWLDATIVSQPTTGVVFPVIEQGDINIDLGGDCTMCPTATQKHAITMPGIGTKFVFDGPAQWVTDQCGGAKLQGVVVASDDPNKKWELDVMMFAKVSPGGDSYPPPGGSPKKELAASAYKENGGPVDTNLWHYYLHLTGTLTGLGAYAGAVVEISNTGPSFQVGFGANGKSLQYGASGWLNVLVVQQPFSGPALQPTGHGDININLEECP